MNKALEWKPFETIASAKWVLAGEHAVLRGATAVALPLSQFTLRLRFSPATTGGLLIRPEECAELITELVLRALEAMKSPQKLPSGFLELESTIPTGAGLGSSAALCVAITRWLGETLGVPSVHWQEIAKNLENRFHGKSSGMDVAVILANQPVTFSLKDGMKPFSLERLPRFTFHDTGLRCATCECISKVAALKTAQHEKAIQFDEVMTQSAQLAQEGLKLYQGYSPKESLERIAQAMRLGQECFKSWGLLPPVVETLEKSLLEKGALACKLTGAGGGGFLVALWPETTGFF